jgi:hypothetical protein
MSIPALTPAHQHLAAFAGAWAGDEALAPSPWSPGGAATGRHVFAVAAGGFSVTQDYAEERDGAATLTGHGVFTVDPDGDDVLWFWFDSIGYPPAAPSRGRFDADGTRLVLEKTTPRGTQRATFARDGDRLRHEVAARLGDATAFTPLVTATYVRERAA